MSLATLASRSEGSPDNAALLRKGVIAIVVLALLAWIWPIRTVPTGSRGVITVGGAIRSLQAEGFTLIAPWQKMEVFSIRAEQADIENAEGSTSDTQPVKVSLTVRYPASRWSRDGHCWSM